MAGRRTNLTLLWATLLALVTGVGAFLVGTPPGRWMVVAHGVVALSIVVLTPWKSAIAARGLSRPRSGRAPSLGLAGSALGALATGLVLVSGAADEIGPFTTMQWHVGFGLLTVVLTVVHIAQRPVSIRRADLSRRNLVRTGGLLAGAGGLWLVVEGALDVFGTRGGSRRFTGSHEIVDPASVPFTQWLDDRVQHLDADTHRIATPDRLLTVADVRGGRDSIEATLDCTGGWFTTQTWSGTRLDRLLDTSAGASIVVRSTTGYWRRFPIDQADRLLLATDMADRPLPDGNGGPVRLVAPDRRGYWWVKWVETIETDDRPPWWQPPLPTA